MNYSLKKTACYFMRMCTILSLLFLLTSCRGQVSLDDLYGTYVADYEVANEQLTINEDGTFLQKVTLKSSQKVDIAKGIWRYDLKEGYLRLDNNFMVVVDGLMEFKPDYLQPQKAIIFKPVGKFFGNIRIGTLEGVLYKKIEL